MTTQWVLAPAQVSVHVAVSGGFPAPDVSVQIDVAGPDLVNPNPTNFVNGTPQIQKAVGSGQTATFQVTLSQVGFYGIRASAILGNALGSVSLGPTVVTLGVGSAPTGTIG